eukprot:gnl/Spiro4/1504_TR813_c0_g1_i1.p1 gnl/Spiro4/1504_TR813_c0_g1~~gnl/Spiro4/1504_TR813_c0_g1_i1.p1  ORF type:complete len:512 (+),score=98.63 gnl/Spiro4/1504_TR813_c0_g1_i1:69-1604(+)
MGKNEGFLTPKAISNRIKAKGLQKLKWFCQMCQKQCRDDNGFKCHLASESHHRQMLVYAQNPTKFKDEFSSELEKGFVDILKRRFGSKRVKANTVYQEYISDRTHTHMNGTVWHTLGGFVRHLGAAGIAHIEETEKGWYLTYIDRDPLTIARQEAANRARTSELFEEERQAREIAKLAKMTEENPIETPEATELQRSNPDERISLTLKPKIKAARPELKPPPELFSSDAFSTMSVAGSEVSAGKRARSPSPPPSRSKSAADDDESRSSSHKRQRTEHPQSSSSHTSGSSDETPHSTRDHTHRHTRRRSRSPSPPPPSRSSSSSSSSSSQTASKRPRLSALEEIRLEESERRREQEAREKAKAERAARRVSDPAAQPPPSSSHTHSHSHSSAEADHWLVPHIVVKFLGRELAGGKFYGCKGVVEEVVQKYGARIRLIDSGKQMIADQSQLETVLPALGGRVRVVNGPHRGCSATLLAINVKDFCASIRLESGAGTDSTVSAPYEHVCKIFEA